MSNRWAGATVIKVARCNRDDERPLSCFPSMATRIFVCGGLRTHSWGNWNNSWLLIFCAGEFACPLYITSRRVFKACREPFWPKTVSRGNTSQSGVVCTTGPTKSRTMEQGINKPLGHESCVVTVFCVSRESVTTTGNTGHNTRQS
jgi:hypothetical protein